MTTPNQKRGFAALTPERLRKIASDGGKARSQMFKEARARRQGTSKNNSAS